MYGCPPTPSSVWRLLAARAIDVRLESDPFSEGESRPDNQHVLFELPLGIVGGEDELLLRAGDAGEWPNGVVVADLGGEVARRVLTCVRAGAPSEGSLDWRSGSDTIEATRPWWPSTLATSVA